MSKVSDKKQEIASIWEAAEAAIEAALKARAKATHATAVVTVSQDSLANAVKNAAEANLAADEAERCAREESAKAREALEQHLGLPSQRKEPEPAEAKAPVS